MVVRAVVPPVVGRGRKSRGEVADVNGWTSVDAEPYLEAYSSAQPAAGTSGPLKSTRASSSVVPVCPSGSQDLPQVGVAHELRDGHGAGIGTEEPAGLFGVGGQGVEQRGQL